jgi:hypothetical protein
MQDIQEASVLREVGELKRGVVELARTVTDKGMLLRNQIGLVWRCNVIRTKYYISQVA